MSFSLPEMSTEECKRLLRRMELEAYSSVISAFRAQGELGSEKLKLLQDLCRVLKIPSERHKAETRRAANDDQLTVISKNLTGQDSGSSWLLEGRRIIPVMPRLLPPTLFTELASTVSKMATKNPLIYRPKESVVSEDGVNIHVRDPDEEDTLSPVMVPELSPQGLNNNNVEAGVRSAITQTTLKKETGKSSKPTPLILSPRKRARSPPTSSSVTVPPKTRAISPPTPSTPLTPSTPVAVQKNVQTPGPRLFLVHQPRGLASASRASHPAPVRPHSLGPPPRLRVRGPVPQIVHKTAEQVRPLATSAPPTARTPLSLQQIRPLASHLKIISKQGTSGVSAESQGKPNVIVLHKNSPAANRIATASQDVSQAAKPVSSIATPAKRKVGPLPNNVRIITVPSSNASTAAGITVKSSTANTQSNVIVLDLSAEQLSKSPLVLSDLLQSPQFIKEINGVPVPSTANKVQNPTEPVKSEETPGTLLGNYTFEIATSSAVEETNGNHVIIGAAAQTVVDPQIEFVYANEELMAVEQTVDIFGTLSSSEITEEGAHVIIQDDSVETVTS